MVEMGTHLATERAGLVTLHLRDGAPQFYPNHQTSHHVLRFQERNSVWQGDLLQGCFDLENCLCLDEEFYRDMCRCHV